MSKDILKIKNLNVEFPLFGGILQREVSKINAVKIPIKIMPQILSKKYALKIPQNLCIENPPKNFALKFPQKFLKNYA